MTESAGLIGCPTRLPNPGLRLKKGPGAGLTSKQGKTSAGRRGDGRRGGEDGTDALPAAAAAADALCEVWGFGDQRSSLPPAAADCSDGLTLG